MECIEQKKKELEQYMPQLTRQPDFEQFWKQTKEESERVPIGLEMKQISYPARHLRLYEVSYNGFDGTRIFGWYMEPVWGQKSAEKEKLPCLVNYHGFSGDRGVPSDFFQWTMAGMAVLTVDCREQGGVTGNEAAYHGGMVKNVTSKGLLDPKEYYYRAVYMDCIRALDVAEQIDSVDKNRLVVHGISQGGGIGTAVCGLDKRPAAALLDVPSCADLERRVWGEHGAFSAVADYLRKYPDHMEQAMKTLSYFDTMNLTEYISCPVSASVGLKDNICPPECFFAAYNRIDAPKEVEIFPFNGHDGAKPLRWQKKLEFLQKTGIISME